VRLIVWNIRSGTDRKWQALMAMSPDVAVLCEAVQRPKALSQPALGQPHLSWEWDGTNVNKGLAIAAWGRSLRRVDTRVPVGRWSIAARTGGITIVGVWSCPLTSGAYAGEVGRALDAFAGPLSSSDRCIVAGDLNVSGRHPSFQALRRRMDELGLVSAYHHVSDEPFGWESAMTWTARHDAEASYHIDFAFVSRSLADDITNVDIRPANLSAGKPLSDHSPIVIDFAEPPSR
jgi:hypothetical protein